MMRWRWTMRRRQRRLNFVRVTICVTFVARLVRIIRIDKRQHCQNTRARARKFSCPNRSINRHDLKRSQDNSFALNVFGKFDIRVAAQILKQPVTRCDFAKIFRQRDSHVNSSFLRNKKVPALWQVPFRKTATLVIVTDIFGRYRRHKENFRPKAETGLSSSVI